MTVPSSAVLAGTTFEGDDGNKEHTGTNLDWDNVSGVVVGEDQDSGGGDNSFGQGSKESMETPTIIEGGIPPNKNDLTKFYVAYELGGGSDVFLYLAWERLQNSGSANLDFEINKVYNEDWTEETRGTIDLGRSGGDLLVTYDFGGSGTPVIGLYVWTTTGNPTCVAGKGIPCWAGPGTLDPTEAIAAVNTDTGLFGEAAINLSEALDIPADTCTDFGSAFVKSRSSGSSVDASLKDFIAPEEIDLATCGSLTVKKVTTGQPTGMNAPFSFVAEKTSTGGTVIDTTPFNLTNGGTKGYTELKPGSYRVTEGNMPSILWTSAGFTCVNDDTPEPKTIVASSTSSQVANVTLAVRQNVTCTFTNAFTKAAPTAVTAQSLIPNDTFTLSGAFVPSGSTVPGGTVSFQLFAPNAANDCSGTPEINASGLTLSAGSTQGTYTVGTSNTSVIARTEGTWRWLVVYTGDTYNSGVTKACGVEQFTIDNDSTTP